MKIPSLKTVANCVGKLAACLLILGVATLSQTARSAPTYATAALADHPVAFWQLTETNDPSTGTAQAHDSTSNGYTGTYGTGSLNGFNAILAPQPPTYLGFTNGQGALQCAAGNANSPVMVPPLNLNTNPDAVTIAMWINPSGAAENWAGLLMHRDSTGDGSGIGFGGTTDGTGMSELAYTWNNNSQATWGYNSGLYPVAGIWQFVALVVQSNSATLYLFYVDPTTGQPHFSSAVNSIAHTPEAFSGGYTSLGSDVANGSGPDGTRVFPGAISDVAVYDSALSEDQILALFSAGVGVSGFAPNIGTQPVSPQYVLPGSTVRFRVSGINGASPFGFQWQLNGTNVNLLPDSANFLGANTNALTILSATTNDAGTYNLIVTNAVGTAVSSNATLTIQSPALVGEWLDGSAAATNQPSTNQTILFLDVSGYSLATNHPGYLAGAGNYVFTNDVPPGKTGSSLLFFNGDTGIAISNSSTLDASYDNTFDDRLHDSFTIAFWAKGLPAAWSPWVSKDGDNGAGWQLRDDGRATHTNDACFTVRDNNAGANTLGTGGDDMATRTIPSNDGNWHLYVGTYNAGTGLRNLYVDAALAASETNNTLYALASAEHLCIGAGDTNGTTFLNFFTGEIYDVRVYNYDLGSNQVVQLYGNNIAAMINVQPQPPFALYGRKTQIIATAGGTPPIAYQWQLNGTNVNLLPDSTNFIGANSNVLTILSATATDVGSYQMIVTNAFGTATSSNAALSIVPLLVVGEWFNGSSSLADVSGYSPAGTHDGYDLAHTGGAYYFTNDVPPGRSGTSLYVAADGIGIKNSSTADASYTNTFDDNIQNATTVAFWARGWPAGWNPFVSKYGENGVGWQLRNDGNNNVSPCWTIRGAGGTVILGTAVYGNQEDMAATSLTYGNDGVWHCYVGTFNAVSGIRSLYVDGQLAAQAINSVPYALSANSHLCIGARDAVGTLGNYFSGEIYDLRISNYDWTTNEVAIFSGVSDPAIVGQPPESFGAYLGGKTQISAAVRGTAPFTNQWQFNGTNLVDGSLGGAVISGSTSSTLKFAFATTSIQGAYRLVVSNSKGVTVSSNAIFTVIPSVPAPAANLVGAWLTGAASLADVSGYSPAGMHDGYGASGSGTNAYNYWFTNDAPPGLTGQSLYLAGNTAIAISNSSTLDPTYTNTFGYTIGYTNTFDDPLTNFTVTFWAKPLPTGTWNPWVSKYGENAAGWQLRNGSAGNEICWTVRDGSAGSYIVGSGPDWSTGGDQDDMHAAIKINNSNWHFYTGTFNGTTGIRNLYIDGVLEGQEIGNVPYFLAASSHLSIGGRDAGGNSFGNYFVGEIYGVRIYNTELTVDEVNNFVVLTPPVFNGPPVVHGNQFVLSWTGGKLLQATNLAGPWTPTGATSPYTNIVSTSPQMFFRLSNQ